MADSAVKLTDTIPEDVKNNLGTRRIVSLPEANFPDADQIVRDGAVARKTESKADVMLVNPPAPDGALWIRTQHRVGRRTRENMVWPQVSLAQMAALMVPDYTVAVSDAMAERMSWPDFEDYLREVRPKYYLTQVTAPTLTNDMYGVFLAKSLGAVTIGFGTHVTPVARETLRQFPALDYVLRGEPEMTLRELVDTLEAVNGRWAIGEEGKLCDPQSGQWLEGQSRIWKMWKEDATWKPSWTYPNEAMGQIAEENSNGVNGTAKSFNKAHGTAAKFIKKATKKKGAEDFVLPVLPAKPVSMYDGAQPSYEQLAAIRGLSWRWNGEIISNWDRHFFESLDDLPMPMHHLLPFDNYRMPMIKGKFTFIVTSRGCPAGCKYCIKHVSYQNSVRLRSPKLLVEEMKLLKDLGIVHVHMYADLFTVNRDQVMELCDLLIEEDLGLTWTCNSRVDYVDEELLHKMGKAGCMLISWGIESANEMVLKRARKGYKKEQAHKALKWAKDAGIKNWGYFIIGLPGETVDSIKETMAFSKEVDLDIALFHVAAPYPGTPFFFEVIENNWFRSGTNWEEVDMDKGTVLDYENLSAEELMYWQKRAFREWAFRPKPVWTMLRSMNTWQGFKSAIDIGLQTLGWVGDD